MIEANKHDMTIVVNIGNSESIALPYYSEALDLLSMGRTVNCQTTWNGKLTVQEREENSLVISVVKNNQIKPVSKTEAIE